MHPVLDVPDCRDRGQPHTPVLPTCRKESDTLNPDFFTTIVARGCRRLKIQGARRVNRRRHTRRYVNRLLKTPQRGGASTPWRFNRLRPPQQIVTKNPG